jgi:YidC/Oxa1 family membrane protein insertase
MILQMVVLIPVYNMVRYYEYQFSKGYFVWIGSEWSHEWPMWLGKNLASFDVPMFALYLGSTLLFSLLQPPPADPQQAQQQKIMMIFMPLIFGVMMWFNKWSSAFMFYWLTQNLVSLFQTWRLKIRYPILRPAALATDGGPTLPAVPSEPLRPMSGTGGNGNGQRPGSGSAGGSRKRKKKKDPA